MGNCEFAVRKKLEEREREERQANGGSGGREVARVGQLKSEQDFLLWGGKDQSGSPLASVGQRILAAVVAAAAASSFATGVLIYQRIENSPRSTGQAVPSDLHWATRSTAHSGDKSLTVLLTCVCPCLKTIRELFHELHAPLPSSV